MVVTKSTAAQRSFRQVPATGAQPRRIEAVLLVAGTLLLALGVCLSYIAMAGRVKAEAKARPTLLNLNSKPEAQRLAPLLTSFQTRADRQFAADLIAGHLQSNPISSVSALTSLRADADLVRQTRGLVDFRLRLGHLPKGAETVPLMTARDIRAVRAGLCVRELADFRWLLAGAALSLILCFWVIHAVWVSRWFTGDQILLPVLLMLTAVAFLLMATLRDPLRDRLLFPDFAVGVAFGCLVLLVSSFANLDRPVLTRLAYVPLALAVVTSLVLIAFGYGPGQSDAKVNLELGGVTVQPAELIKLLFLLFLAGYFSSRWELLRELSEKRRNLPRILQKFPVPSYRHGLPVLAGVILAVLLFIGQGDMGPALVLSFVFFTVWGIARRRTLGVLVGCSLVLASFLACYMVDFPRTVAARVGIALSPWDNFVRPGGDHIAQSLWTFAAGGAVGTGLGLAERQQAPAAHTDLVLAVAGEQLGFIGLAALLALYAVLIHRTLKVARSAGEYGFFLALGVTLLTAYQVLLISAGILGVAPLSGVVTPFLNYGKSSTVANFLMYGLIAGLSRQSRPGARDQAFGSGVRKLQYILCLVASIIVAKAFYVQVWEADEAMLKPALVVHADGHRNFVYNPRIRSAIATIPRGTIYDSAALPLATVHPEELLANRQAYESLGLDLEPVLRARGERLYPMGEVMFHVLGDDRTRLNWAARNTSFIERDENVRLQGFNDHARLIKVKDTSDGKERVVFKRDYRELSNFVKHYAWPEHPEVKRVLGRDRNVRLTVTGRLQARAAAILEKAVKDAAVEKGAIVVVDPETGALLASTTYPFKGAMSDTEHVNEDEKDAPYLLDRARYGTYPPGSSFKLVTAGAALLRGSQVDTTYTCRRLPDGRVGNWVRGWGRPIRDDIQDKSPHGALDMRKGLVVSCNAYFAQLGTYVVGAEALRRTADQFGIRTAAPNTAVQLRDSLPQASYGQGQVTASPLQMARVAATIANGGVFRPTHWIEGSTNEARRVFDVATARQLGEFMRGVVLQGTGRRLSTLTIPIAGKTGTAERRNARSHAWFVGFAPYGPAEKRIAFAVLLEGAGYGGQSATAAAGGLVEAIAELGLVER
ncbi:MAG: hypothetical protein EHM61_06760 [Acidobacteria bacterium]|nr:MAG: hypothetical protein EHM61_06760 [Acidobacteriota bacterium]